MQGDISDTRSLETGPVPSKAPHGLASVLGKKTNKEVNNRPSTTK